MKGVCDEERKRPHNLLTQVRFYQNLEGKHEVTDDILRNGFPFHGV
jgi:hypothetical protein